MYWRWIEPFNSFIMFFIICLFNGIRLCLGIICFSWGSGSGIRMMTAVLMRIVRII